MGLHTRLVNVERTLRQRANVLGSGVVLFDPEREGPATAVARQRPGTYLLAPVVLASSIWQAQTIVAQAQLAARAAHFAAHGIDPGAHLDYPSA